MYMKCKKLTKSRNAIMVGNINTKVVVLLDHLDNFFQ